MARELLNCLRNSTTSGQFYQMDPAAMTTELLNVYKEKNTEGIFFRIGGTDILTLR